MSRSALRARFAGRVPVVPLRRHRALAVLWALLAGTALALPAAGASASDCASTTPLRANGTFNLRVDNDVLGGLGQDQGYSNGFLMSWVSPNLVDFHNDPCLPPLVRRLNRHLAFLQPDGFDEQNMTMGLGQLIYTPADKDATGLVPGDRPFVGALMLSLGYNARRGDHLRTSQLRFGLIGPTAGGKQVQDLVHGLIGDERFHGWSNQLHNEPALQFLHERRTRVARHERANGRAWDLTRHWGTSLGNFATYANAGAEWRYGLHLPDDFGTAPLRPAGENTSPVRRTTDAAWKAHVFLAFDARWVLRDITLDGNTFRASPSVDKRPLVADIGYGIAAYHGDWRFAFARYHRSREFRGQKDVPVYGTVTIGRSF